MQFLIAVLPLFASGYAAVTALPSQSLESVTSVSPAESILSAAFDSVLSSCDSTGTTKSTGTTASSNASITGYSTTTITLHSLTTVTATTRTETFIVNATSLSYQTNSSVIAASTDATNTSSATSSSTTITSITNNVTAAVTSAGNFTSTDNAFYTGVIPTWTLTSTAFAGPSASDAPNTSASYSILPVGSGADAVLVGHAYKLFAAAVLAYHAFLPGML